jgi:hypothetical protein
MTKTPDQERLRLEIAATLDAIAAHKGWSDDLWSQFNSLLKRSDVDGILAYAREELIHYSGEFNSTNLLGFRVKPDENQVTNYKDEFRQLADAIRSGTTWVEYKRANRIFEASDLNNALKRIVGRVGSFMKPRK